MQLAAIDEPALHDPPLHPVEPPRLPPTRNIFHAIRDVGVVPLLHPYESFAGSTERFLREASQDPKVRAIKMTLYRTSSDARIPGYLIDAARNGKQVAVVVELKARFDEAANIGFAGQLEEAGIHVSYGVVGLKTHCKVVLVVREDYDGLRRYVHIGTGNYHPGTARIYTDIGLLTTNPDLSRDVTELFNYLTTGYGPQRGYGKLLLGPARLKQALLDRIEREIRHGQAGLIQFKMNALEDADITRALYRASRAVFGSTCSCATRVGCGRDPRPVRDDPRGQHCRTFSRARPGVLLPQSRRGRVLHRVGGLHEAQPGESRRSVDARRGPARATRAADGARPAIGAQPRRVGNARGRLVRQAAVRARGSRRAGRVIAARPTAPS